MLLAEPGGESGTFGPASPRCERHRGVRRLERDHKLVHRVRRIRWLVSYAYGLNGEADPCGDFVRQRKRPRDRLAPSRLLRILERRGAEGDRLHGKAAVHLGTGSDGASHTERRLKRIARRGKQALTRVEDV